MDCLRVSPKDSVERTCPSAFAAIQFELLRTCTRPMMTSNAFSEFSDLAEGVIEIGEKVIDIFDTG